MREAVLSEAQLHRMELSEVDLTGAELFRAGLGGLDLSRCTIDNIVLSQSCAELKGAVIAPHQAPVVARILGTKVQE